MKTQHIYSNWLFFQCEGKTHTHQVYDHKPECFFLLILTGFHFHIKWFHISLNCMDIRAIFSRTFLYMYFISDQNIANFKEKRNWHLRQFCDVSVGWANINRMTASTHLWQHHSYIKKILEALVFEFC
jgi:hypothetical protein